MIYRDIDELADEAYRIHFETPRRAPDDVRRVMRMVDHVVRQRLLETVERLNQRRRTQPKREKTNG